MSNVFANTVTTVREVATVGVKVAAQAVNVVNDTHQVIKENNAWYNNAASNGVAAAWDADNATASNRAIVQAGRDVWDRVVPAKDDNNAA